MYNKVLKCLVIVFTGVSLCVTGAKDDALIKFIQNPHLGSPDSKQPDSRL